MLRMKKDMAAKFQKELDDAKASIASLKAVNVVLANKQSGLIVNKHRHRQAQTHTCSQAGYSSVSMDARLPRSEDAVAETSIFVIIMYGDNRIQNHRYQRQQESQPPEEL